MKQNRENPFFETYRTPFGTPPFDQIETEQYEPAFDEGIWQLDEEVRAIADNTELPTFENTIIALERSGKLLDKVISAFFNVLNAEADDEMMDISQRVSPKLSESSNNIYLNEQLFARVKSVYDRKDELHLPMEDARLLEKTFEAFCARGAALGPEEKEKYRKLSSELSLLSLTFDQNALKDKNRYELLLTKEDELEGLPESIREAAALRAKEKGKTGWLFNLSAPSYVPFMRYSALRGLREKMYREYMSIGNKGDEYDNKEIIREIVNIRLEIARLMGYTNYADYKLKHTMAKTPARVYKLLNELLDAYKPVARNEYETVQRFASETEKENITVMPWDWSYYSEKLKDIRFNVNDEMTRPYFELNHVKKGVFGLATQLYGITFKENKEIPVYHPEVEAYEVYDADGKFLSILYTDFHPRDGKQSGAWMNSIKEQYRDQDGKDSRPQIIIVMNFTRPTETKPSLLTFDEVNTLLHEFGHALHGMLTRCHYPSVSGTSVARDFVELPSQINEHWATHPEVLKLYAKHYQTGEIIPDSLIAKMEAASKFNQGFATTEFLAAAILDIRWHEIDEVKEYDVRQFEKEVAQSVGLIDEITYRYRSTYFSHIFTNDYCAGYYSYIWAEVLDADAFDAFKEHGIFDPATAKAFRENILEKGGSEDPMKLYRQFRGAEPNPDALLRNRGLK